MGKTDYSDGYENHYNNFYLHCNNALKEEYMGPFHTPWLRFFSWIVAFAWAVIASTKLWLILYGIYGKRATKWGCLCSMIDGFTTALIWMVLGRPFGIHGFIPGIIVGLILIVFASPATVCPHRIIITFFV